MTAFLSDTPEAVVEYIESAIRMPDFRTDVLDLAERRLGIDRQWIDRALVRAKWAARWKRAERSKTLAVVEAAVNDVLRNDHVCRLVVDRRFRELPKPLRRPDVRGGGLTVADAKTTVGVIHIRSFLEVTPPDVVVRAVHVAAAHRQEVGLKTSYPFPLAWDLTAGSGTVRRVLAAMGGNVVASDLTPLFDHVRLDARDIGKARHHREPLVRRALTAQDEFIPHLDAGTVSINKPHVIFIDPPSRGQPTHQDLYGGGLPAPQDRGRDLAELERADWAMVVGGIAVLAVGYVAHGGAVSLLLREGRRHREHTFPEEGIVGEVLGLVRERVPDIVVLDDLSVVYDPEHICNQVSVGRARLPMRHVVLARGAKP